ncbi:hypothetical protein [Tychonema sp. LEGE 07203]|nr:hypothetical protein [Tychonema sp. LEGE 07203]
MFNFLNLLRTNLSEAIGFHSRQSSNHRRTTELYIKRKTFTIDEF